MGKSISSSKKSVVAAEQQSATVETIGKRKHAKKAPPKTAAARQEVSSPRAQNGRFTKVRIVAKSSSDTDSENDRPYDHQKDGPYFTARLKSMLAEDTKERDSILKEPKTLAQKLDDGERAHSEVDIQKSAARLMTLNDRIGRIEAAQKRMESGKYGICEATKEPISIGQLRAQPLVTKDITARVQEEKQARLFGNLRLTGSSYG